MLLLRSTLNNRIGRTGLAAGYIARLWAAAIGGAIAAWAVKLTLFPPNPILAAIVVLGAYGAVFLGTTVALGIPEATTAVDRVARWGRRVR
jgi:putative peptidoglycan lipid II flippase